MYIVTHTFNGLELGTGGSAHSCQPYLALRHVQTVLHCDKTCDLNYGFIRSQ